MAALNLPLQKTTENVEDPAEAELDLDTFAVVFYYILKIITEIVMNMLFYLCIGW